MIGSITFLLNLNLSVSKGMLRLSKNKMLPNFLVSLHLLELIVVLASPNKQRETKNIKVWQKFKLANLVCWFQSSEEMGVLGNS